MTEGVRNVFRGRVLTLNLERVQLPNGHVAELEIAHHPGGAAVVAIAAIELARRELAEEAGTAAARWQELGAYLSSPGVFTEVIHLYLARELSPVAASPEDHEVFEVQWVPLAEAVAMATDGRLVDGKSIVGLFRAREVLR